MMTSLKLPDGFEALELFVAQWASPSTVARAAARDSSSDEERRAFYEAATPFLAPALEVLDSKPLVGLDERETRLLNLMMGLGHVALAVESQREAEATHVVSRRAMNITMSSADWRS